MRKKQREAARPRITLFAESANDAPLSYEFDLQQAWHALLWISVVLCVLFTGTLFFFRELELNRKLSDRVLELESSAKLDRLIPRVPVSPTAEPPAKNSTPTAAAEPVPPPALGALTIARIQSLSTLCQDVTCEVEVDLIPAATGTAQGEILFVLETEIVRIGNVPTGEISTVRKKYLVEPGAIAKDILGTDEIVQIPGKTFRFTRALKTKAQFNVGRALQPIALNVYIYDDAKNLIQHERRIVEMEPTDD